MSPTAIDNLGPLFPEPLTAFDVYMVSDDKPDYPSTNVNRFVFRGAVLDRVALQSAFEEAINWEPGFFLRLNRRGLRTLFRCKPCWEFNSEFRPQLQFQTIGEDLLASESGQMVFPRMDLERSAPLTITVLEGRDSVAFHIDFHHCVGDGMGILEFIGSWLTRYALKIDPTLNWRVFEPDLPLFLTRGLFEKKKDDRPLLTRLEAIRKNVLGWIAARPYPIKNLPGTPESALYTELPDPEAVELPTSNWRVLPGELINVYHSIAKRNGVSLNTLFVRDLFLTLRQWSGKFPDLDLKRYCFRVLMPRNLRTEMHRNMPCANVAGYTFFDFSPSFCANESDLLQAIQQKTHNNPNSTLFLRAIAAFNRVPGLISLFTTRKCACTAVISNVGRFAHGFPQPHFCGQTRIAVPGLELKRYIGAPLVRPGTPVSIGITTHENETILTFALDRMHFNEPSSRLFIELYLEQIRQTCNRETQK